MKKSNAVQVVSLVAAVLACGAQAFAQISASPTAATERAYSDIQGAPAMRDVLQGKGQTLSLQSHVKSSNLETTRFQHYFNGLEVVGSMALHHVGKNGVQIDDALSRFDLNTTPTLSMGDAVAIVKHLTGDQSLVDAPTLKILPSQESMGTANLVYWAKVKSQGTRAGREIVIDAHSGEVLANMSSHYDAVAINIFDASDLKNAYTLPDNADTSNLPDSAAQACEIIDSQGDPLRLNLQGCPEVITSGSVTGNADASAQRAQSNAQTVLDYWANTFGRNSYDDKGSPVNSVVHAGVGMGNAFWDNQDKLMAYGDGDGKVLGDMTKGLNVVAHEMTHAVTHSVVEPVHMWESGALDEAFSDFFGLMVSNPDDWVIGKEVFIDQSSPDAGIRNLKNPAALTDQVPSSTTGKLVTVPYPMTMKQEMKAPGGKCTADTEDNCYVHLNSTIPSHVSYLVHEAIGHDNAQKLYYMVQQHYLTATETFSKMAKDAYKACGQLFDSATCDQVVQAYATAGLNARGSAPINN